jgi:hypothetical protein
MESESSSTGLISVWAYLDLCQLLLFSVWRFSLLIPDNSIINKANARWHDDHRLLKVFLDLEDEMGNRPRLSIPLNSEAGGSSIGRRFNELPEPPAAAMSPKSSTPTDKPKPPTPTDRSK